jgi:rhodanese-related sulfurtransferase
VSRFNAKLGAGALVGLATVYLILSVALGRSARAEVPPDLTALAADAGLDVWKAAAFVVQSDDVAVVDVRPADAFARYHLPLATNVPGATSEQIEELASRHPAVLVYAGKNEVAQRLVADARALVPTARIHYLVDGARAWYLALSLPVPLFAELSPPDGYAEALAATTAWFQAPTAAQRPAVTEALQTLAKVSYQPTLLKAGKKAASAGAKKKIGGGCG